MKYLLLLLALVYALSPYDILPDFLFGWGWLDDLLILGLLWWYFFSPKRKQYSKKGPYQEGSQSFETNGDDGFSEEEGSGSQFKEKAITNDPYAVLGISRDASPEEITNAYKRLAKKYHPDKVLYLGDEFKELAEKRFKEIQKAYQDLMSK
ncbi:MAG: J domain-containing protein [Deltaproteobacteria bacterium]|nr:J domain-containing protein [Deltaproteobacteria bacterium]